MARLPPEKIASLRDCLDAMGGKTAASEAKLGRSTLYRVLDTGEAGPKVARGVDRLLNPPADQNHK